MWIITVVVAVLIVSAIVYGFTGTMSHPAVTNPIIVPQTTDSATTTGAASKAP
jgi:hypothetical protein